MYAYALNNLVNVVDPSGEVGVINWIVIARIVIGAASGVFAAVFAGKVAGNVWGGLIGGTLGAFVGGAIALGTPEAASRVVAGMIVGAVAGAIGGSFGGYTGKYLANPEASIKERLLASGKGFGIGAVTGCIVGGLGTTAISVGASAVAAAIAGETVSLPIGVSLGMIAFGSEPSKEDAIYPNFWPGEITYPAEWFPTLEYDPNNPDEVAPGGDITVNVIGGCPPYTWEVSGNGFTFVATQTGEPKNILIADDTSCGTATITVTDNCGEMRGRRGDVVEKFHFTLG